MSKITYTAEQIELLRSNQYVRTCTSKYITFTYDCRIAALRFDEQGWYFRDIFRYFSFPDFIVTSDVPRNSLKAWRRRLQSKGSIGLIHAKKGRKAKEKVDVSLMTKDEYIKYLEAKTAYLEEIQKKIYGHDP
ncbi:MAG: hypothetical protein WC774_03520 [Candidatus Gracilibacteria bacterium]